MSTTFSGSSPLFKPVKKHMIGGFRATFPLTPLEKDTVTFKKLDIHQKIREHDTAVIRIASRHLDWFNLLGSGTPVKIVYWSSNNRLDRGYFFGYVTHVRLISNEDNKYEREIVCVAASRSLRETSQKTYINKTAAEIAVEIGRMFGFKVIAKQHGLRRATVSQTGETYWEFMNKLAKRSGYILRADGTTMYFMPLSDYTKATIDRSPLLSDYAFDNTNKYPTPTVEHVDTWVGDTSDDEDRLSDPAVFVSVSPETGEVNYVRQTPQSAIYRNRSSRSKYDRFMGSKSVAYSREDAELLAKGAAENGLMAIDARVVASGNPLFSPYRTVELALKDRSLSGYWLVKEVTHSISRGTDPTYLCNVVVSTDSVTGVRYSPSNRNSNYRNYGLDLVDGFSSDEVTKTRIQALRTGFVVGTSKKDNLTGRWVHS